MENMSSSKMEIHDRFMNMRTGVLVALEILDIDSGKKSFLGQQLLTVLNQKLLGGNLELTVLETLRIIHCDEYQTSVNSGTRFSYSKEVIGCEINLPSMFDRGIENFTDTVEFHLLYDIIALQLALYCEDEARFQTFTAFYESQKHYLGTNDGSLRLCLKVFECIADSYSLYLRLNGREQQREFEELPDCIPKVIELWMKQEELKELKTMTTLLPKLVLLFGTHNIITPLWNKLLNDEYDLNRVLDVLGLFADVCFPTTNNLMQKIRYEYCLSTDFWSFVLQGLDSNISNERTKALHLLERTLDFIELHESQIINHPDISDAQMVPFLKKNAESNENSTNLLKTYFLTILQTPEERIKDLSLGNLPDLIKGYSSQNSEGYFFHKKWLQCICKTILRHETIDMRKFRLQEILAADLDIYEESFFEFLVYYLNNILLFEFDYAEEVIPEIVKHLYKFFIRCEEAQMPLIKTFVRVISRLYWCELPIYWILQSLYIAGAEKAMVCNIFTSEELKCVRNLVTLNFTKNRPLAKESRIVLRKMFCKFISPNTFWPEVQLVASTIGLIAGFDWMETPENLIKKIIKTEDAQTYICEQVAKLWSEQSTKTFSNTIIVLIHSGLIFDVKNCRAQSTLHDLFKKLCDRYRRFLIVPKDLKKLLELASDIINAAQIPKLRYTMKIKQFLAPHIQDLKHTIEHLTIDPLAPDKQHTLLATAFIKYIAHENVDNLTYFYEQCLDIMSTAQKLTKYHWMFALNSINCYNKYHVLSKNFPPRVDANKLNIQSIVKYLKDEVIADFYQTDNQKNDHIEKQIEIKECCENVAILICDHLKIQRFDNQERNSSCFKQLEFLIETEPEVTIGVIADTFRELLDPYHEYDQLNSNNINILKSIVQLSFRLIYPMNYTEKTRSAIYALAKLIINTYFLKLDGAEEIAVEWVNKLMEKGEKLPEFKLIFISKKWNEHEALLFLQPFISCLLHGVTSRPDQKIVSSVDVCYGFLRELEYRKDKVIPARAIVALMDMMENRKSLELTLRKKIVQELLFIWKKHKDTEHSHNSQVHRIKHRVMQTILVLSTYMTQIEIQNLNTEICHFLISEKNELSVQLMLEWLIIRIYMKTLKDDSIWGLIVSTTEKRPEKMVSPANIVFHISKLFTIERKIDFICNAVPYLLPSCMVEETSVRLYSQVILVKLHEMLPEPNRRRYQSVVRGMQVNLRREPIQKNAESIMEGFYLNQFNVNEDYNLQIIYEQLPRLMGLPINDRIENNIFKVLIHIDDNFMIPMHSFSRWERPRSEISPLKLTDLSFITGDNDQENIPPNEEIVDSALGEARALIAEVHRQMRSQNDDGIIVVSSLIDDETQNLARAVRTCEIYGAKEAIIGNLDQETLRAFQRSNVLIENSTRILEIKKNCLEDYLRKQRSIGWKLVGVKQRTNNTNPHEVELDPKTILVLGIEENDIPESLIRILDVCVEMP